jgi:Protein of unknown function (DUF1501)
MKTLCSRRHFLYTNGFALGGLGLLDLLLADAKAADKAPAKPQLDALTFDLSPKPPHFTPKAKAMISMYMVGGPSQIDLFDFKPELVKLDGKPFPGKVKYDNPAQASTRVQAPMWKYKKYGKCGMEMSELLPHLGGIADEITLIRSTHTGVNNHIPSMYALNAGNQQAGRPTLGSWLLYGLGCETKELPAYVALTHPAGGPLVNSDNWTNGWLPSIFQGTAVRPKEPRILNIDPPDHLKGLPQTAQLDLLRKLNDQHQKDRSGESDLTARISNYELAAKMQLAAKEAFDITQETKETLELYGVNDKETKDYGTRCLIARRLVERGVRFVQIFAAGQTWDHHDSIFPKLPTMCKEVDKPAAALVADLKRRGLLDSTLVHWGGEMGRLPTIQVPPGGGGDSKEKLGRDHNTYGFSMWAAGGGLKGGHVHGATDEFGHHAVEDIVTHSDWLTTVLHQFGLDPAQLTFKRNARELTLTDSAGKVVQKILA